MREEKRRRGEGEERRVEKRSERNRTETGNRCKVMVGNVKERDRF